MVNAVLPDKARELARGATARGYAVTLALHLVVDQSLDPELVKRRSLAAVEESREVPPPHHLEWVIRTQRLREEKLDDSVAWEPGLVVDVGADASSGENAHALAKRDNVVSGSTEREGDGLPLVRASGDELQEG